MCFTPAISLATATVEFGITGHLVRRNQPKTLRPLAAFTFALGLYQFTEFMLCMSGQAEFWARAGFASYGMLPALLLHAFMRLSGKKFHPALYAVPVLLIGYAVLREQFVLEAGCNLLTVSISHMAYSQAPVLLVAFFLYYGLCPLVALGIYSRHAMQKATGPMQTQLRAALACIPLAVIGSQLYFLAASWRHLQPDETWSGMVLITTAIIIAIVCAGSIRLVRSSTLFQWILMTVTASSALTALILYVLFPAFAYDFPSIYCHFALLYGIAALLIAKHQRESVRV